jgi:very-short-patch-repair endonuclease
VKTDTNGGQQNMIFLTYNGLMKILSSTRKSNLIEFSEKIGIDVKTKIYSCIESDTIKCIKEAFSGETMTEQYNVDKYRIDLYFDDYDIAVECDEQQHKTMSNKLKDIERENKIKEENPQCFFIRYYPFDKDFKIFNVINAIYKRIIDAKEAYYETNDKLIELEEKRYSNEEKRRANIELEIKLEEIRIQSEQLRLQLQQNKANLQNTIKLDEPVTDEKEDERDPEIPDNLFVKARENTRSPKVYQYDPETLEFIQAYDSIIAFVRNFHNSSGGALREAAKNNRIYKGFRWILAEREITDPPVPEPTVESRTQSIEFIAMIDIKKTNILEVFPTQRDAAKSRNLAGFTTISRAIKQGSISSGHYWNFFDKCSEEMKSVYLATNKLPEPHIKTNSTTVSQVHPVTGEEIKRHKSITEVIKKFQLSRNTLYKVSENGNVHNGFKWKVING